MNTSRAARSPAPPVRLPGTPLHAQIERELRARILDGRYAPMSRITVRRALGNLQKESLIPTLQGKGSFVAKPKARPNRCRPWVTRCSTNCRRCDFGAPTPASPSAWICLRRRQCAAHSAGWLGTVAHAALPAMEQTTHDPNPDVRKLARLAITQIGAADRSTAQPPGGSYSGPEAGSLRFR